MMPSKRIEHLIVDTSAFIKNVALQDIGNNILTTQEVINEITNKRQLRNLVVLPYDLKVKDAFVENVKFVTEFSKLTGDYLSLSATDIKVIALTLQLEKEHIGSDHLKKAPLEARSVVCTEKPNANLINTDVSGFFMPKHHSGEDTVESDLEIVSDSSISDDETRKSYDADESIIENETKLLVEKFGKFNCEDLQSLNETDDGVEDILIPVANNDNVYEIESEDEDVADSDDEVGWITPSNVKEVKKNMNSDMVEEKQTIVACMTTDFAMQNVLKQIGLSVVALDGRVIKQLRTYIFRCYTCFKTTSVMTKLFCPKCGNKTLKKVSVSLDENGKQKIHINFRRPLTSRGKRFSLPTPQGGKYANNPILYEDQCLPQQRITRLARTTNDPLNPDYISGYSPFVMRDVNSKSAVLGLRNGDGVKHWMKKNPNEARRRRK